jgi:hypothetical protein
VTRRHRSSTANPSAIAGFTASGLFGVKRFILQPTNLS